MCKRVRDHDTNNVETWQVLGDVYLRKAMHDPENKENHPENARKAYIEARVRDQNNVLSLTGLGMVMVQMRQWNEALEVFDSAQKINPYHAPAYVGEKDACLL